jgi:hypothetical protein
MLDIHCSQEWIMFLGRCWLLIGLLGFCQGCNLAVNFSRDVVFEVERASHECAEKVRDQRLAAAAWNEVQESTHKGAYSTDYARGFKDGYADYLFAGGTGEPPLLPPRHYWGVGYETPDGVQAIQDWFAGYRHGAVEAEQSGYRQLVMIPLSSPVAGELSQLPTGNEAIAPPLPPPAGPLPETTSSAAEKHGPAQVPVLPLPKKVKPGSPYHAVTTPSPSKSTDLTPPVTTKVGPAATDSATNRKPD